MASLFEAYITNLGKYNEGELVGETLKFPTTTEEVQGLLKRIGVDGVRYPNPRSYKKYGKQRGWMRGNKSTETEENLLDEFRELTEEELGQIELPFD